MFKITENNIQHFTAVFRQEEIDKCLKDAICFFLTPQIFHDKSEVISRQTRISGCTHAESFVQVRELVHECVEILSKLDPTNKIYRLKVTINRTIHTGLFYIEVPKTQKFIPLVTAPKTLQSIYGG